MELIRGLINLQSRHRGCVATIGNFDGVHLGHQAVIRQLTARSVQVAAPTTVITFEPHPLELFARESRPARLSTLREKLQLLAEHGVQRVLCLRFNQRLASMPAEEFVRRVLVEGLGIRWLVIGDDFRFGRGRAGDFAMLQAYGSDYGYQVERTHSFEVDGMRVSSTLVRSALAVGDLALADRLLGRRFEISGRVAHGDKRGRDWGFPTANIHLNRSKAPLTGIFAVEVLGLGAEPVNGVANLGNRPTVGGTRTLLEVHLLDFNEDIYGRRIRVHFLSKLREEERFENFDALKAQIARDKLAAERYFAERR